MSNFGSHQQKAKTAFITGRFQSAKTPTPLFDVSEDTGKFVKAILKNADS